jgi:hypothetical protein
MCELSEVKVEVDKHSIIIIYSHLIIQLYKWVTNKCCLVVQVVLITIGAKLKKTIIYDTQLIIAEVIFYAYTIEMYTTTYTAATGKTWYLEIISYILEDNLIISEKNTSSNMICFV